MYAEVYSYLFANTWKNRQNIAVLYKTWMQILLLIFLRNRYINNWFFLLNCNSMYVNYGVSSNIMSLVSVNDNLNFSGSSKRLTLQVLDNNHIVPVTQRSSFFNLIGRVPPYFHFFFVKVKQKSTCTLSSWISL